MAIHSNTPPAAFRPVEISKFGWRVPACPNGVNAYSVARGRMPSNQNLNRPLILDRSTSQKIRRLYAVVEAAPHHWPNEACVILDLEKAFAHLDRFTEVKTHAVQQTRVFIL